MIFSSWACDMIGELRGSGLKLAGGFPVPGPQVNTAEASLGGFAFERAAQAQRLAQAVDKVQLRVQLNPAQDHRI